MNCDAKDLCDCAPLYEGWGGVAEWQEEEDDNGKGIGAVDESIPNIVVNGNCDVGRKMVDGCIVSKWSRNQLSLERDRRSHSYPR